MAYTTIKKPSDYFNTITYTGNQTPNTSRTVGFQPDFIWFKNRSVAYWHQFYDAVRGTSSVLYSNNTDAESSVSSLVSFDSNGFTTTDNEPVNGNGEGIVAWNWLAGTTSGITTDGNTTITPSNYSFNQTSGFSILSFTGNGVEGAKLAHGLGTTPAMIIIKKYSTTGDWVVYHKNLTATNSVFINYNQGQASRAPNGYIYSPDDTNITLSNHGDVNSNGVTTVAYCFAEKKGFSKFGSYIGNGSTDGTFVYTGFKPAFVIVKRINTTGNWCAYDNKRPSYNVKNLFLMPNLANAEETRDSLDFVSNGFKLRNSDLTGDTNINISGSTYIYMAFAEEPLVGDNPATAR